MVANASTQQQMLIAKIGCIHMYNRWRSILASASSSIAVTRGLRGLQPASHQRVVVLI